MKNIKIIKRVTLSLLLYNSLSMAWEINTHRAIDRCAISNECNQDGNYEKRAKNLHWFAKNIGIDEESYGKEKLANYTLDFDNYSLRDTGETATYFGYVQLGERYGISKWNQTFKDTFYTSLIEVGTILEDALWAGVNKKVTRGFADTDSGQGRFNYHFYDPQNDGAGLSIKPFFDNENAINWAENGGSGKMYNVTDITSTIYHNDYSYEKSLEYFKLGFTSYNAKERKTNRAKMFVSLGYQLHLLNDMSVPAHTRDDSHPTGDSLEGWMQGGKNGSAKGGFKIIGSSLAPNNNGNITKEVRTVIPLQYHKSSSFRDFYKTEAKFTGTHFYSDDTIMSGFGSAYYDYKPNGEVIYVDKDWDTKYLVSTSNRLNDNHKKIGMIKYTWFQKAIDSYHDVYAMDFNGDITVLQDNGINLIPRAVANAEGFINYFFRGRIKAIIEDGKVKIANVSDVNLVASADTVTFKEGGWFSIYYENDDGKRIQIETSLDLKSDLAVNQVQTFDISEQLDKLSNTEKTELTIVYGSGNIGSERGIAVTYVDSEKDSDNDGMPDVYELKYSYPFIVNTKDFKYLDPNKNDADEDIDGDGVSNYQEYLDGTHPFNSDDFVSFDLEKPITTDTSVTLKWNKRDSADGYKICIAKEPIGDKACTILDGGRLLSVEETEKTIDTFLATGVTYYTLVRAYKFNKLLFQTNEKNFELKAVLLAPTNLQSTSTSDSITLQWNEVSSVGEYRICMSESTITDGSKCTENGGKIIGVTSTIKTISEGLKKDTTYYFRVRGLKDGYESAWSYEVNAKLITIIEDSLTLTIDSSDVTAGTAYIHISSSIINSGTITFYDNGQVRDLDNGTTEDGYVTLTSGRHIIQVCSTNTDGTKCSEEEIIIVAETVDIELYTKLPLEASSNAITNNGTNLIYGTTQGKLYSLDINTKESTFLVDLEEGISGLFYDKETSLYYYSSVSSGNIYKVSIENMSRTKIYNLRFPDGLDYYKGNLYVVTADQSGVLTILSTQGVKQGTLDTKIDDIVGISHTDKFLYILSEDGDIYQTNSSTGKSTKIFSNKGLFEKGNTNAGLEGITVLNNRIYVSYINDSSVYLIDVDLKDYE